MRIAMWSGPRNISTAMMRAWENRSDTTVIDEPLYAYYLQETGVDHPARDEVIAAGETDWRKVAGHLTGPIPDGKTVYFQKHMSHHLLPEIDRGWLRDLVNAYLIRDPREVLLSYSKKRTEVTIEDVGIIQQAELFAQIHGPVLDARDVLENPRRVLGAFCEEIGVPFDDAMLSWPAGPRKSDGVWAKHWYDAVMKTTGFQAWTPRTEPLPADLEPILKACRPHYDLLHARRIF